MGSLLQFLQAEFPPILFTLWCMIVSIGSLYFVGLPIALFLSQQKNDDETYWLRAPFLGLSAIVLPLQDLVYSNIRLQHSVPLLWLGTCLLWVWIIKTKRFSPIFSTFPRRILLLAFSVFLIQGMGLFLAGAKYYVGRAWHDQFSYTATAQFLIDYPFNLSFNDLQNHPYLVKAATNLKFDRIGQSIFQGFLAVSGLTDAKTMFEPAVLLAPFLITLAIYSLARKLSGTRLPTSFSLAAAAAGTLPGIAMVHLESFFSQALAIPFLMLWPSIVSGAIEKPDSKRLFAASLLLAAGTSIYTEFYIFFVWTGALIAVFEILRQPNLEYCQPGGMTFYIGVDFFRKLWRYFSPLGMVLGMAFLLNIGFAKSVGPIFHRSAIPGILAGIYPWGIVEGLQRVWFGDIVAQLPPILDKVIVIISIGLVIAACLGFMAAFRRRKDGLTLSLLVLMIFPFVMMLGPGFKYQSYKLLLSVSPLLPLGIALTGSSLMEHRFLSGHFIKIILFLVLMGLGGLSSYGTIDMTVRSGVGHNLEEIGRGGAHKLLATSTRRIQDKVSAMHGEDIYILYKDNFFDGNYINGWLSYFARKNRVWVANPRIGDAIISEPIHPQKPERHAFLLTSGDLKGHGAKKVFSSEPYHLYKFSNTEWDTLSQILEPRAEASLQGFGPMDMVNLSESAGGDGSADSVFKLTLHASGKVESIEMRNIGGMHSVWDTLPGNGAVLLGVADIDKPNLLLNKRDGSVDINTYEGQSFLLYVADNSSIKEGKTRYQVTVNFSDGRMAKAPVK